MRSVFGSKTKWERPPGQCFWITPTSSGECHLQGWPGGHITTLTDRIHTVNCGSCVGPSLAQ